MTFLQEPTQRLAEVGQGLDLANPETAKCRKGMNHIVAELAEIRLESLKYLRAMSEPDQFEKLVVCINMVRNYSFNIIMTLGDPEQNLTSIEKANDLLDALDIHIRLRRHVDFLKEQPVSIEQDLNALVGSMKRIRDSLVSFSTSVRTTFDDLKQGRLS